MRRAGLLFICLLVLSGCAGTPKPPPLGPQIEALKTRIFVQIAQERRRLAVEKPLVLDSELVRAAQAHADDMAQKLSFGPSDADSNVAVKALLTNPQFRGYVGETSAAQYFTPQYGIEPDGFARGFLDIWMKSEPNRATLAFPSYDRAGIGAAANGNAIYVAALFVSDFASSPPQDGEEPEPPSAASEASP